MWNISLTLKLILSFNNFEYLIKYESGVKSNRKKIRHNIDLEMQEYAYLQILQDDIDTNMSSITMCCIYIYGFLTWSNTIFIWDFPGNVIVSVNIIRCMHVKHWKARAAKPMTQEIFALSKASWIISRSTECLLQFNIWVVCMTCIRYVVEERDAYGQERH